MTTVEELEKPVTSPRRDINSVTFQEAAQKNSAMYLPVLLDIRHPEIVWKDTGDAGMQNGHMRVVNDISAVKYKGDDSIPYTYFPCTFNLKLPQEDGKKKANASITISSVDSRIIEVIRSVTENLKCRVVAFYTKVKREDGRTVYAFTKTSGKEFDMGSVSWDGLTAQWELDPDPIMDLSFPRDKVSNFRAPGATDD